MKADSLKISKVFSGGGEVHYVLPHFQREYTWDKVNWTTLLQDTYAIHDEMQLLPSTPDHAPSMQEPEHFLGSLVVINDGTRNGTVPAFKLVDGQQRLTTISLMLCALSRIVKVSHPMVAKKAQRLLINADEADNVYYKLLPTTKYGDRVAYTAIIQSEALPPTESRIPEAYDYIYKDLQHKITAGTIDPEQIFLVLTNCFQVVFIDLNQNESPYKIFESLNAKGKALSQADLVRNYIAMKLPAVGQEKIFNKYWSTIEHMLQEKRMVGRSRLGELTAFLRHYLAMRTGVLCSEEHVYARVRDRIEREFAQPTAFEAEIARLQHFAKLYNTLLRPETEPDSEIREAMWRLNILEMSTAYPFLLAVADAHTTGILSTPEYKACWAMIENYFVRRYLAGEPTNYLNKMFPSLWQQIDKNNFVESLRMVLAQKNYPSDSKVRQALLTRPLYDKSALTRDRTILILETINRHLSAGSGGYTVLGNSATIEHILPQTLDDAWHDEVGDDWEQIHQEYLHTLGNLTLVTQEWNSALSNAPFAQKKPKLAAHALQLNQSYFSQDIPRWNEDAIRARADYLIDQVLSIWPAFATPQPSTAQTHTKPTSLTIQGHAFPVVNWTDVLRQTVEFVAQASIDFDAVAKQLPGYLAQTRFNQRCYQLPNGWWVYLNLSSKEIKRVCAELIRAAGIPSTEWTVTEIEVGSGTSI